MKLSDEYIKYYEEYRKFENTEQEIRKKLLKIVQLFDSQCRYIENFNLYSDNSFIEVDYYQYCYRNEYDICYETIPIEFLDMSMDEIKVKVSEILEQRPNEKTKSR